LIDSKPPLITKEMKMKKKLLVLLITIASTMMPNLASAIAIDASDAGSGFHIHGLQGV